MSDLPRGDRKPDPEQPVFRREWEPSFTLERHIAEVRKSVGEKRWAELQAEWS